MTDSNEDLVLGEWEVGRLGGWEIQITPARSTTTTPRRQARRFFPDRFPPQGPHLFGFVSWHFAVIFHDGCSLYVPILVIIYAGILF